MYRLNTPTRGTYGSGLTWLEPNVQQIEEVGQIVRLIPWKPECMDGPEYFCETKRICMAPTIEQCFIGISQWSTTIVKQVDKLSGESFDDEFWWALTPVGSPMLVTPPHGIVEDVIDTDEVWILEPWDFRVIGRIQMFWAANTKRDPLEWAWVEGGEE